MCSFCRFESWSDGSSNRIRNPCRYCRFHSAFHCASSFPQIYFYLPFERWSLRFFVSLIVVAVALIICAVVAREMVLPFAVAEILTLVVVTSIYVVYKNVLAKKRVKK